VVLGLGTGAGPSPAFIPNSDSRDFLFVEAALPTVGLSDIFDCSSTKKKKLQRKKEKDEKGEKLKINKIGATSHFSL
jgi:hypothetical protein